MYFLVALLYLFYIIILRTYFCTNNWLWREWARYGSVASFLHQGTNCSIIQNKYWYRTASISANKAMIWFWADAEHSHQSILKALTILNMYNSILVRLFICSYLVESVSQTITQYCFCSQNDKSNHYNSWKPYQRSAKIMMQQHCMEFKSQKYKFTLKMIAISSMRCTVFPLFPVLDHTSHLSP